MLFRSINTLVKCLEKLTSIKSLKFLPQRISEDLQMSKLKANTLSEIFGSLQNLTHLTDLSLNLIMPDILGARTVSSIKNSLSCLTDLKSLNLVMQFGQDCGKSFLTDLSQAINGIHGLESLVLKLDRFSPIEKDWLDMGISSLSEAISNQTTLKKLHLEIAPSFKSEYFINSSHLGELAFALSKLPELADLKLILLKGIFSRKHSTNSLAFCFTRLKKLRSLVLNMTDNQLISLDTELLKKFIMTLSFMYTLRDFDINFFGLKRTNSVKEIEMKTQLA